MIGICNGFQILSKLGVLPQESFESQFALVRNKGGRFINKWVTLKVHKSHCIWTKDLPAEIQLPIRHAEGRIVTDQVDENQLATHTVLSYQEDINGSLQQIAAVTNSTGTILGLMPHPEAAVYSYLHPNREEIFGLKIFESCVNWGKNIKESGPIIKQGNDHESTRTV